ncbi:MAG: YaaL family protein [Clostridia bacterium]|nr:YaaL family protein [Clostridia bacterium]
MENQKVGIITLKDRIENLYTKVFNPDQLITEEDKLIKMLQDAREDWQRAEARFQEVTDNDLIDHTIYDLQAAKTRYSYLLKMVKERGIKCDFQ